MNRLLAGSFLLLPLWTGFSVAAAAPTASGSTPVDVAVEPFTRIGGSDQAPAWIGTAVQQNLVADLARVHFHPQAVAEATTQPSQRTAKYLIRGSYQNADDSIRFTAQVLDADSGAVVGGITATGPVRDLFGLEDSVSGQVVRQLRQLSGNANTHPAAMASPDALASAVQPPSAAPTVSDGYDGSVLQAYVNANTAPSNDYADQENASRTRQTYWSDFSTGVYPYGGFGYPGYFGGFYPGIIGIGYGGFGYGGFGGYGRFGYAGLGRGTYFGHGGNYGYGFGGGFHGGVGGGFRGGFAR